MIDIWPSELVPPEVVPPGPSLYKRVLSSIRNHCPVSTGNIVRISLRNVQSKEVASASGLSSSCSNRGVLPLVGSEVATHCRTTGAEAAGGCDLLGLYVPGNTPLSTEQSIAALEAAEGPGPHPAPGLVEGLRLQWIGEYYHWSDLKSLHIVEQLELRPLADATSLDRGRGRSRTTSGSWAGGGSSTGSQPPV
jgi:hypothetical protein